MTTSSFFRRAVLLALPWVSGCLDGEGAPVVGGPTNICTRDADCREGACNAAQRRCVALTRTEVSFLVLPPNGAATESAFPTLTQPRTIRTGDAVDLTIRAPRTVYGTVTVSTDDNNPALTTPVSATVSFTPSDLPGFLMPVTAVAGGASLPTINRDQVPFTWSAVVPDGIFDVSVTPTREFTARVPPLFQARFDVRRESVFQRFDITYPRTYSRWSGVIQDPAGSPLQGLTVRAIDASRGGQTVSTVVSTSASSDAPGSFAIDIAPGFTGEWTLRISSEMSAGGGFTIDLPRSVLQRNHPTGREVVLRLPTEVRQLYVPTQRPAGPGPAGVVPPTTCLGCVRVTAAVEGRSTSGATRPLRNASVTLHASIPMSQLGEDVKAWFEVRATTDAEGTFSAWLIPGDYDVLLTPQSSEFSTTLVHGFRVRSDAVVQAGRIFTVEPRVAIDGRVITPMGDPVRGARVSAIPFHAAFARNACLEAVDMRALAPRAGRVEATTQTDGSYRLDVDPGLYRLLIEPGDTSGFSATLSRSVCVLPITSDGSLRRVGPFDVRLEPPVEIHGVVRDAMNRPAPGAAVEGIIRVREPDAEGVVVRVGRTAAGRDGAYSLLLPGASASGQ